MNWITKTFQSSIGQKLIMGLTGIFLCTFLVVHVSGNFQLFKSDYGLAFNEYTVFMTTNPLIKTVSYLLYASIIFHAVKGLHLAYKNAQARPVKYAVSNGKANSHWTSRNMGVLGTIILVFIVVHMADFWYEYKFGEVPYAMYRENIITGNIEYSKFEGQLHDKKQEYMEGNDRVVIVKDLYLEVSEEFKELPLVILYILSMAAIAFHLYHGFQSAFQTMGINHSKYNGIINFLGIWVFSILVPLSFAAMPLYFYFIK
jgi:succinate dehydrogenase / fumarate reductase cytochrome b subunit